MPVINSIRVANVSNLTTGGNTLVTQETLSPATLKRNANLVVLCTNSTLLVIQQKPAKTKITLEENEQDADNVINNAQDVVLKAISDDFDEEQSDLRNEFEFDSDDITELLNQGDYLSDVIERLAAFSFSVDSTRFLKVLLELSQNGLPMDDILQKISQMDGYEVKKLLKSKNVFSTFIKITSSDSNDPDDDYGDSNEDYAGRYFEDDEEEKDVEE